MSQGSPYHALHAVGKQQDNAVLPDPLGLPGTDELVNDALSSVVEIPKLGFPKHQGIGTGHGKAQLESCGMEKQLEGWVTLPEWPHSGQ